MNWLREVTVDNPMFAELRRPIQRMAGGGPSSPLYRVMALAAIVGFFTIAALFARSNSGFEPVVALEMGALAFLVPPMMYKTIAGERDKRSWDILLSAPVTPGQIVVGRFALGALGVAAIVLLGFLVSPFTWPQDLTYSDSYQSITYTTGGSPTYQDYGAYTERVHRSPVAAVFSSQAYVFGFGLTLVALALFISARSRRGFTALASTYALFFCWLALLPMLIAFASADASYLRPLLDPLIPFTSALQLAATHSRSGYDGDFTTDSVFLNLVLPNAAYLFLTGGMVYWASKTLHFPDNDVRFLARKPRA